MPSSGRRSKETRKIARHELIGLEVVVEASGHPGFVGVSGRVVDETKHTLVVERAPGPDSAGPAREVVIPKRGQTFAFRVGDASVVVQGDEIAFQPEDRTKRIRG